jgi:hypothetical protein
MLGPVTPVQAPALGRGDTHEGGTMRSSLATTAAALAVTASLVSCGADTPAVCGSVSDLKTSVDNVTQIDVTSSSALSDLKSGLSAVQSDLAAVKSDATSKFGSQLDAVESSYDALRTSIASVQSGALAATLAEAGAALSTFGTDVKTLISDIQSTC